MHPLRELTEEEKRQRKLAGLSEQVDDYPFSDIENALRRALRAKYEPQGPGPDEVPFIVEVFSDKAIIRWRGKLWMIPFTISVTGDATLGEPEQVRAEYVPVKAGEEE